MKVFDLAKKLNLKSTDLMKSIKMLKLPVKSHMVELTSEQVEQIEQFLYPKEKKASTKKASTKKATTKATAKNPALKKQLLKQQQKKPAQKKQLLKQQ